MSHGRRHSTGDRSTQGFDTHRCERMPDGTSLRRYRKEGHGDGWVLGRTEWDSEYDYTYLLIFDASVRFCPWCGDMLE